MDYICNNITLANLIRCNAKAEKQQQSRQESLIIKQMKKFVLLSGVMLLSLFGIAGCSQEDTDLPEVLTISGKSLEEGIADALTKICENRNGEYATGGYVVYDSESNEFFVLSAYEYAFFNLIGDWMDGADSTTLASDTIITTKAPRGNDWHYGGRCKSKMSALKLGVDIAKKIPEGRNFEIHCEYDKSTGYYNVWYRLV